MPPFWWKQKKWIRELNLFEEKCNWSEEKAEQMRECLASQVSWLMNLSIFSRILSNQKSLRGYYWYYYLILHPYGLELYATASSQTHILQFQWLCYLFILIVLFQLYLLWNHSFGLNTICYHSKVSLDKK